MRRSRGTHLAPPQTCCERSRTARLDRRSHHRRRGVGRRQPAPSRHLVSDVVQIGARQQARGGGKQVAVFDRDVIAVDERERGEVRAKQPPRVAVQHAVVQPLASEHADSGVMRLGFVVVALLHHAYVREALPLIGA